MNLRICRSRCRVVTCPPPLKPVQYLALGSWTKGGGRIPTKRYSTEQIVSKLRQAEEELEREDTRLKKLVADQAFDKSILKEVASGNF